MTCEQIVALSEIAMLAKFMSGACWALGGASAMAVLLLWRP